jgi:hypothetical protein
MRRTTVFLALGWLLMVMIPGASARGVTVYIQRVVVADPGDIRLGDLMHFSGDAPLAAGETLAQDIASVSNRILYVPSQSYLQRVGDAFGRDSIFVGSRSLVIPRGLLPDNEIPLLDRLVDFLTNAGVLGGEVADIEVRTIQVTGTLAPDIAPAFQLVRSSLGSVEASFSAASDAGQASGRVILALKGDAQSISAQVRSNDAVRVIFHKGPITIEMPGRTLASAAVGQSVNVLVTDSQKSFAGRLLEGKAVDVELP